MGGGTSSTPNFGIVRSKPVKKRKKGKKKPFLTIFPSRYSVFEAPFFKLSCLGDIFIQGGTSNTPNFGIIRSKPVKKNDGMNGSKTRRKKGKKNPFLSIFPSRYSVFEAHFFKLSCLGGYFHSGGHIKHTKFWNRTNKAGKKKKMTG